MFDVSCVLNACTWSLVVPTLQMGLFIIATLVFIVLRIVLW